MFFSNSRHSGLEIDGNTRRHITLLYLRVFFLLPNSQTLHSSTLMPLYQLLWAASGSALGLSSTWTKSLRQGFRLQTWTNCDQLRLQKTWTKCKNFAQHYFTFTLTFFAFASSRFGMIIIKTPSWYSASALSEWTETGKATERWNDWVTHSRRV